MSIGSVSVASQNFDTSVTILPSTTLAPMIAEPIATPAPSREDSFESSAPKVNYAKVDEAQKTIASKGLFDLGKPVEPVVREAGKDLIAAKQYNGPISPQEAAVIRSNLSGDQLKEFNKDYAAGKFNKPIEEAKLAKLEGVLNNDKSTYNALRQEADTVRQLGYKMTAVRYRPAEVAQVVPANGRSLNTKG